MRLSQTIRCAAGTASRLSTFTAAVLATALLAPGMARAAEHALIMTVGTYIDPVNNLEGIDKDAAMARRMAIAMGVKPANIIEMRDQQVTRQGMGAAFEQLQQRVKQGDGVFVYFSGHGDQRVANKPGRKCMEGMVPYDQKLFEDDVLEQVLADLSNRASRVVMMNDSCFSGGASTTKSLDGQSKALKPKRLKLTASEDSDYICRQAVNKSTRDLFAEKRQANMLYIAASSDREVAFPGEEGSLATVAWANCLSAADRDRNGVLSGEEMRACAQAFVDRDPLKRKQTITLTGNAQLPISFSNADAAAASTGAEPVSGAGVLNAMRSGASPAISVDLRLAQSQMKIMQDRLDFTVQTNKPGYLYIFHVGADGETVNLLFPNQHDQSNQITAGTHQFPRDAWRVRASGPAGTSYVMAMVTEAPRDFSGKMNRSGGAFSTAKAVRKSSRDLFAEATGANSSAPGRFGTSGVMAVREVP